MLWNRILTVQSTGFHQPARNPLGFSASWPWALATHGKHPLPIAGSQESRHETSRVAQARARAKPLTRVIQLGHQGRVSQFCPHFTNGEIDIQRAWPTATCAMKRTRFLGGG